MTIKNGNSDFTLTATQTGPKRLKITWSRENVAAGTTIQVFRPGDGKQCYTYTYTKGETSGGVGVDVPYPGEYKVHISTARGVSYDYMYCVMKLTETLKTTKTITSQDVTNYKVGQILTLGLGGGLLTMKLIGKTLGGKVANYVASFMVYAGIADVLLDSGQTDFPSPQEDDTITSVTNNTTTGYQTTITYQQAAKNGGGKYTRTFNYKFLTFNK